MTAPIWMAAPPEVHSTLLSSGPGPGPVLAAAGAWNSLSVEYASAADELTALLAQVQAGAWEGPSAESYVAAHAPYLAWLMKASADSAATAAQHEVAAAAYTAALAAMPTLPELAANHVVHGTLLATNFFGINTIPIAVNETDYARMWVQAATVMGTYDVVSTAAVAATPQADPAPQILQSDAQTQSSGFNFWQWLQQFLSGISNQTVDHDPTVNNWLDQIIAQMLRNFGYIWDPAQGTLNGLDYDSYTNAGTFIFWVARALELLEDFQQFFTYLQTNPVLAIQYLISLELFDWPTHIAEIFLTQPELLAPALILAAAPLAPLGAFAGLAGLAAIPAPAVVPAPLPIAPAAPPLAPVLGPTPMAAPAAPATAPAPAPTATASTVASPAPPPAPAAAGAPGFFPPYVVGPPGIGQGTGMSSSASSGAKKKAPEPDTAAAAAAATAREAARARRRQRAHQHDHGDEFMDMNVDVNPDWGGDPVVSASDRGAGNLGFAGTAHRESAGGAAGLTTLAADEFGSGPRAPMLPGSWDPDANGSDGAS
jgi:PPE-repeat protein